ncbi:MAG: Txe/YoeB family addiction module toxin [Alphaproteobacteria bacterium]|nr:Txe/YoeB family addiction module toxin [Alphaproteobacteria bacterium]MBV9062684.1 Txe/YoeB family addiction module toxin [Alphaproteobacteria bacterium]
MDSKNPKIAGNIDRLIADIKRSAFAGIGKPEPLRLNMKGLWSRRITEEHRLVYRVEGKRNEKQLEILQCRFHYR